MHVPQLILDLALILAAAGVTTLLFKRLHQPMVLGYILAGLLVGPQINLLPTISDVESIKIWGDIGVIFLLFSLGLEFSFKKLLKLGGSAAITGLIEVTAMLLTGYIVGQLMGWSLMDSLFLGGIIAISSTTIILKAFDELELKRRKFAGLVMGVLIVEDLVAVLLLVLLSTMAISNQFAGQEMLWSVYKLVIFLAIWFISGIYLLPTFFRKTAKLMNDESLLLASLSFCFVMVVLASSAGFSAALGAFVMGSILAETPVGEKIEHLIQPLKNLFGAVFFVSVGMLIDPAMILKYAIPVLILTLVVVVGKSVYVTLGALASGQPLKQSVQSGMSMAQIGEFSFIIADLGQGLGVTSSFLYPIAVGVSVITTFSTPLTMKLSEPVHLWLERKLPERWLHVINRYSTQAQTIASKSHWQQALKAYFSLVAINTAMVLGIMLLSKLYLAPFMRDLGSYGTLTDFLTLVVTFVALTPFLWALMVRRIDSVSYRILWVDPQYNRGPLVFMAFFRVILGILLMGFLLDQYYSVNVALTGGLGTIAVVFVVFSTRLKGFYHRMEDRFIRNLNAKDNRPDKIQNELTPWDAHLSEYEVLPEMNFVGKTLEEMQFRESIGINIAMIERGELMIYAPNRYERLFPGDKINVIGTDVQLDQFSQMLEDSKTFPTSPQNIDDIQLQQIEVNALFPFRGQSIRESGIRELTEGLIVGIERNGERILNPESNMQFEKGDILWIVASKSKLAGILGTMS